MLAFLRPVLSLSFCLTVGTLVGVLVGEQHTYPLWLCVAIGGAAGLAAAGLLRGKLLDAIYPRGDDDAT